MNRIDFMSRLSSLLADLPESERKEALQYYEDYLNDAGVENEEEVLEALGTPEELAASIRKGLREGGEQKGEFSEYSFGGGGSRVENEVVRRTQSTNDSKGADSNTRYRKAPKKGMSGGMIALIVILCILAAPIGIPVVISLLAVVFSLLLVVVILTVVFLFVGIICIVAGIWSIGVSIAKLFLFPAGALMSIGASLLAIGIGIFLTLLVIWVCPKVFRGLVNLVSGLFHKKGGKA